VRALAGYASTRGGRELTFAVLVNGYTAPARDVEAVLDSVASHLASLTLAR
jgi:D-alanyl-D-alanine carboxypeptidase